MTKVLHLSYRPTKLEEVFGQKQVVKSLEKQLAGDTSHTYLFTGPSGTGKTSLARIMAEELGCASNNLLELDAASRTGVDDMRDVMQFMAIKGFGASKNRGVILDECHMLSKNAWNSLLKSLEEPDHDAYWFLCTTELHKVPKTVQTRCALYKLGFVDTILIQSHLQDVADEEEWDLKEEVIFEAAQLADGSVRQGLVNLALVQDVKNAADARRLIAVDTKSPEAFQFCQLLWKGCSWIELMQKLEQIQQDPETVRRIILAYFGKIASTSKKKDEIIFSLAVLECFTEPYFDINSGKAALLVSLGQLVYGEE